MRKEPGGLQRRRAQLQKCEGNGHICLSLEPRALLLLSSNQDSKVPKLADSQKRVSPMSSTLKTDDIFNIADDRDHSDSSNDSEEENERKITANTLLAKGSTRASLKGKNTVVFGLDGNGDSEDEESEEDGEDTFSQDERDSGKSSTVPAEPGTFDSRFAIKDDGEMEKTPRIRGTKKSKKVKPLTPEALEKFQAARDKAGIVYLSKIPPFMKPIKIRHLLGKFGEIGRIYLAPEGKFQHEPKIMRNAHCWTTY